MSIAKPSFKGLREAAVIFFIGEIGYSLLEILWRGYTHWTMALTGGLCFLLLYYLNQRLEGMVLWKKCLAAAFMITGIEFLVGCLVNLTLHWQVWDYTEWPFNIWGQVCLFYSVLWYLLAIPVLGLCGLLKRRYFSR